MKIKDIKIELYRRNRKYSIVLTIDGKQIKGLPENTKYDEIKKYVIEKCNLILPSVRKYKFIKYKNQEYSLLKGYSREEDD